MDRSDLVRAAVHDGLEELTAQARRTAAEAQAIDAAFQERARRNFEMLGEAVRLMGASAALPPAPLAVAAPAPTPEPTPERAARPKPAAKAAEPVEAATDVDEAG